MTDVQERPIAPLWVDTENEWVWLGEQRLTLTPKPFAVLRYLIERPGRLITKEEILKAAWPGIYVSDETLQKCISRIRNVLGDEVERATVHRDGVPPGISVHWGSSQ